MAVTQFHICFCGFHSSLVISNSHGCYPVSSVTVMAVTQFHICFCGFHSSLVISNSHGCYPVSSVTVMAVTQFHICFCGFHSSPVISNNHCCYPVSHLFLWFPQFAMMETVISGISDMFPRVLRKNKTLFTFIACLIGFLLGIPQTTKVCPFRTVSFLFFFM